MKTLLILRHGKSSWEVSVSDHDRPLKKRGKNASIRMGQEMCNLDLIPDLILTSTARRAQSTARRIVESTNFMGKVIKTDDLYLTGLNIHFEILAETDDQHQRVLVVGHNPDLTNLATKLSGEDLMMATATLVCIDLKINSWSEIANGNGTLRFILFPRDLELL